jgi:GTP-binding protein YchF
MQIGIVGLPFSGKSTLFTTLLSHKTSAVDYKAKHIAERGVINVQDERLDQLTALFKPRSKVNATVEYVKVPGLDSQNENGLSAQFFTNLKSVDEIILVTRAFEDEMYTHPLGRIDPVSDLQFAAAEFLLSDLVIIENRLERLEKQLKKVRNKTDERERALLLKCKTAFENEMPLRNMNFPVEEHKILKGFQFLTAKPLLIVVNIEESELKHVKNYENEYKHLNSDNVSVIPLCLKIEKEISELDPDDQAMFLEEMGIQEPALYRLIRKSYDLLWLISFFTVGEDECRSWTIRKGINAQLAAGAIHTDLERGFIRADVVACMDLIQHGSLPACRAKGILRLEGKDYIVRDGDVMEIRFNV